MRIEIQAETAALAGQLNAIATEVQSRWWERFAPTAQGLIEREQGRHFATQSAPDGKPWKALSPLTLELSQGQAAARRRQGQKTATVRRTSGSKMLQNTRLLERSVTTGGAQSVRTVGKDFLIVGTSVPYALAQQKGSVITVTPRMRGYLSAMLGRRFSGATVTIPPRPFLGTSARSRTEMATAAVDALNKTLRGAGKR